MVSKGLNKNFFVHWFRNNGRDFPWRRPDTSPFAFLITEMLVRQTRASSVAKIWTDITVTYPDPAAVLLVSKRKLVRQLKVLGFGNQKATALRAAATYLVDHHAGIVPSNLQELLRIPHIGSYSARAVLCFAFGKKTEVVDVNILRFFSRYLGIPAKPDIRRNPEIWILAKKALPKRIADSREHNYGLLDFTGEICKTGRPHCPRCPLKESCAFALTKVLPSNLES